METSTSAVPYQRYKSKRHSRTISTEPQTAPSPPPVLDTSSRDSYVDVYNGADDSSVREPNGTSPKRRPVSVSPAPPSLTITNGHTGPSTAPSSPTAAASSSQDPLPKTSTVKPALAPKLSTFRHVPLRPTSHAPSPLGPDSLPKPSLRSLSVSPSLSRHSPTRRFDVPQSRSRVPSAASTSGPSTRDSSPAPAPVIEVLPTSERPLTSFLPVPSLSASPSPPPPLSKPQSPSPTPSSSSIPRRPAAPYRPGFQPKGVYRPRTDEFIAARSSLRDRDKIEQRRLERRLEKLIELHFPHKPTGSAAPEEKEKQKAPLANRRSSSLFDLDFRKNPTELWRDVVELRIQGSHPDIRSEEQYITPWEDDAAVSQCPLCTTSFHPLTNRKHHCRLCGRIICSLPPRILTRPQTCSLLFVVDQRTGLIEEVGEGVDYGVKRRGSSGGSKGKTEEDDKFLKGVRICRDCRTVLQRQQYLQEASRVPTFARLYSTLTALEKDIEDTLPQFQELLLSISTSTSSHNTPSAEMRKRLLESFGEYDRLAKRIRQLPAPRGGSQDRVQAAIMTRANLFLQQNMFPLQSLPKPRTEKSDVDMPPMQAVDVDSELAHALQPLLEQEALLESFVEEARAQRKFEDARTLKANLGEIRAEIERIAHASGNER